MDADIMVSKLKRYQTLSNRGYADSLVARRCFLALTFLIDSYNKQQKVKFNTVLPDNSQIKYLRIVSDIHCNVSIAEVDSDCSEVVYSKLLI
jgi:hypothetical protein